jgi:hypothetical protein
MLELVKVARAKGYAIASTWTANRHDDTGTVAISHHSTHMFNILSDDTVEPVSRGWGSMTDKCGTRKILTNVNGLGYTDVFKGFTN